LRFRRAARPTSTPRTTGSCAWSGGGAGDVTHYD
jgi:hypothetical protein